MHYYLGIDGGGTKTTCAVGDDTRTLATVVTGPSNIVRVGEARTRESLQQGISQVCAAAGITPAQIVCTCVGGSGAGRQEYAAIVQSMVGELVSSSVEVVGDMEIALDAAFDRGPGVIVIAGTGSIAYGRNLSGATARAGGWGFAIGDEGSAHWIGRTTVNAVLRASDAHEPGETAEDEGLIAALYKSWGVRSLLDLARAANSIPPPDFAALFPAVASSTGPVASEVLTRAGTELAKTALVVIRRLFTPSETEMVPVATTGSVFRHAPLVRQSFYNELHRLEPHADVNQEVVEPVEGALRRARLAAKSE